GVVYIAHEGQETLLAETMAQLQATGATIRAMTPDEVVSRVPCVRREGVIGAIEEPDAKDIYVHELLQRFLRAARPAGVEFAYNATVLRAARQDDAWLVELSNGVAVAARNVVDAAGAWGEQVAGVFGVAPLGLQPKRRSAFTFKPEPAGGQWADADRWPAV